LKIALSRKNAWEKLPPVVRRPVGALLGRLPLGLILGGRFREASRFVEDAQWWPAERARAYQTGELRGVLARAATTPFYRRTLAGVAPDDLRTPDDLRGLPTTSKETLREHLADMCAVPPGSPGVDYVTTGGTGGTPLGFYIGAGRSAVEYAYLVSGWRRAGYALGTPLAVFRGRIVPEDARGLRHQHDPLLRHHYYSNFHMTDAEMARYLDHLATLGPCFLHVYPSSAAALARFVKRSGRPPLPNVKGVLAESEMLGDAQRRAIEEAFGVRCFSGYGHTEKLVAAAECERSHDYHVWPTYGYCELLDEAGRPVDTPGARGEIVGTGFLNRVVPFVRYRTGDFATFVARSCAACRREHLVLSDIRGHRIQEFLVARDGAAVSWTALNMHDDTFEEVVRFQFFQDTPGRAVLRLVAAPGFGDAHRARIRQRLDAKMGGRLDLTLELVESVALSGAGKAIYVDQRIPGFQPGVSA
jgi:phenylacetate-CoA ligase